MRVPRIVSKVISSITVALLAFPSICFSAEQPRAKFDVDLQHVWFKPKLSTDADTICGTLLQATLAKFISDDSDYSHLVGFALIDRPFEGRDARDHRLQFAVDDHRQFVLKLGTQPVLFGYFGRIPGCGGACEQEVLRVSDRKIAEGDHDDSTASTPASPEWSLLRGRKGGFYALGIVDGHLQLYRIVRRKSWHLSCDIALQPANMQEGASPEMQAAIKAVDELITETRALSGGSGDCGSMGTPPRWRAAIREGLHETLYRPWALVSPIQGGYRSENSWGDYDRIEKSLRLWQLGGLGEYRALHNYEAQLEQTTAALANFYAKQFDWAADRSLRLARRATRNAISNGFGFYMFDPFPSPAERQLRAAILRHSPMSTIRAIKFEPGELSMSDSILDIAVEYPEALSYLLRKGVNPNAVNEFGKTPLMYAAQNNRLEAAKLLLAYGVDPNAATILPGNTCEYTIRTAHMTALHYAARYASVPVIDLLVKNGAVTFSQSQPADGQLEYPVDWLHRYVTAPTGDEHNPNIVGADVAVAASLLRVPSDAERGRIAANAVRRAESEYAKGTPESSYRLLLIAIAAQPDNQKALADLPLVALKAGHVGAAIRASNQALGEFKDPALKAAAWFNRGLICENDAARNEYYDGNRCDEDLIQPFLRAWQVAPTPAREHKLRSFFNADVKDVCVYSSLLSPERRVRILHDGQVQHIYILHGADEKIDPASIKWSVTFSGDTEPTVLMPKEVERVALGTDTITVLQGPQHGQYPVIGGKEWCRK